MLGNSIWLVVGIGAIALAIGYMAGGSKTPILSGILTGVFALVTLATGVMTGSDIAKKLEEIKTGVVTNNTSNATLQTKLEAIKVEATKPPAGAGPTDLIKKLDEIKAGIETNNAESAKLQTRLAAIKEEVNRTPQYVGATLLSFAILFLLGSILGATARAREWFRPKRGLPWSVKTLTPAKASEALVWLAVQEKLMGFGYTEDQITAIYDQWKKGTPPETMQDITTALTQLSSQSVSDPPYTVNFR